MTDGPGSVFIVDDDCDVRASLKCVLEAPTRRVTAFASAEEFLAEHQEAHPCCLLLDLRLPGMTGQELLEHLHIHASNLQVIVLTAYADVPAVLRIMRQGALDVCQKPVDPRVLIPLVDRSLAQDAAREKRREQVRNARRQLAALTPRERQLFDLVVEGQSYKEMAANLGISPRTVEHHRAHISRKLGIDRVADMVRLSLSAGTDGMENGKPQAVAASGMECAE